MPEVLFDLSAEYSQMLNQGIRLSGESQDFFVDGRIASLSFRLPANFRPRRILDFGCGIGTATRRLGEKFTAAEIVGVDTSENALEYGAERYGSSRVRFRKLAELPGEGEFDLCYVNGVFHHIEPENRAGAVEAIYRALRPGGHLALFENNPWNPGTRLVMSRIPFDRDAIPLSIPETRRLVRMGGFAQPAASWSLFYFPRPLACFRFTEGLLSHLPLGAQYCVLTSK
jgi:SAM-dependent methyltransferase